MSKKKIVLASKSPRRRELLLGRGISAEIRPADVEEIIPCELTAPKDICEYLACLKADAVEAGQDEIVISADTIVYCGNEILGKPKDRADAKRMLALLSGSCHYVLTGMCIKSREKKIVESVSTEIIFRTLTDTEIEEYINTDEPYDKAGGYGIQAGAGGFAQKVNGDFENVVGLPVTRLLEILKEEFSYI